MNGRVVYSPNYNIGFFGFEKLHPFDSKKYRRAWNMLKRHFGKHLVEFSMRPEAPIRKDELLKVHSAGYLKKLRDSDFVAGALEVPPVRYLPATMIDWCVLKPMRWATAGTILAAREAFEHSFVVNLGGGFHHAKPNHGEGFCIYSDIALAIYSIRDDGLLSKDDTIAYIDLDAHQGNGVSHGFMSDTTVKIFDMYNSKAYPCYDKVAISRIDANLPIDSSWSEERYLETLTQRLPEFLGRDSNPFRFAIYNAGTDIFNGDPLGQLNVSAEGILKRDLFVTGELRKRGIPAIMVLSGGYTMKSYELVANSVIQILEAETSSPN